MIAGNVGFIGVAFTTTGSLMQYFSLALFIPYTIYRDNNKATTVP
jgi:hypothetical protein